MEQVRSAGCLGFAAAVLAASVWCPSSARAQDDGAPRPYLRVTDARGGDSATLEVAARRFTPGDPAKPAVWLVGAVHIADQSFYDGLQAFLDAKDVVLFEQVKPAGSGAEVHDGELDDAARAKKTERRLRFLAVVAEKRKAETGVYPASIETLGDGLDENIASLVRLAMRDAWGNAIAYVPDPPAPPPTAEGEKRRPRRAAPIDFISLGADGAEGGEGNATDLKYSTQKPVTREERGEGDGIQEQLADAFGLVFQLEAMRHDKPNWRNSDLSIDQVQRRLEEAGADGGALFTMLDGSSFMGKLAGVVIRMIASSPQGRAMFKLMLVEMLSRADELFKVMPGGMNAMMNVILLDRNSVVIGDLNGILEREPGVRTVGIIYGAGHLPDLETRLGELGYTAGDDTWFAAITITPESEGLPRGGVKQMRPMMKAMIQTQIEQMRRLMERGGR
ncbi:MAG: hypothetical protein ACKVU4_04730 [Phycisphaerales bacterium]